ncbi:TPA: DUF3717 domain-containing protein [Burkholderia vietnamiensis]|nr:DUF3717 domain-containing protein [Burkholderia vietnamiensis]
MRQFTINEVAYAIAVYCDREPTNDGITICKRASKLAAVLGTLICSRESVVPDRLITEEIRQLLDEALPLPSTAGSN